MCPVNRLVVGILTVIGSVLVSPPHALAGWEIDVKHSQPSWGGGGTFVRSERRVFQGNRFKEEHFDENGKSATTTIIDLDAERITVVHHWKREYFTATFQESIADEEAQVARSRAEGERSRQELLNRLPAADRAKTDQSWKEQEKKMRTETCQYRWEVTRTDQRETIAGYSAIRHDMFLEKRPIAQTWVTKDLDPRSEMDRAKRDRLAALAHNAPRLPFLSPPPFEGCQAGEPGAEADPSWKLLEEGYVMRREDLGGGTSEVVRVRQREFPASEFEPPPGFTRKPLRNF